MVGFGLVPVARFEAPFAVLGLGFGGGGPFWGSVLVPVVRFEAPFWCRGSGLGLQFGASGPFCPFLGLVFGAAGPFWGSIVVVFGAPFWFQWSVLGPLWWLVRFGVDFGGGGGGDGRWGRGWWRWGGGGGGSVEFSTPSSPWYQVLFQY